MKILCPICSSILLRHFCRRELTWFCSRCYQEMPNLNLVKFNSIQNKICSSNQYRGVHEYGNPPVRVKHIYQAIEYQSSTIDLFVNQNKKRLETIGFIFNRIDLLLVNIFFDSTKSYGPRIEPSLNQGESQNIKVNTFIKAKFLRDSELVLLRICQAILVADQAILQKIVQQDIRSNYLSLKFQIAKIYFVDLIKTIVIEHLNYIALDSSQSIDCFIREIANYFDIAINLMLHPDLRLSV